MVGEKMLNPWLSLPMANPFVLANDEQIILEYKKSLKDKNRENQEVHLEVFPEPYAGNPQAKIILLNLNPGYYPRNKEFGDGTADFHRMWRANLAHEPQEYPFYHLDSKLKGSPGEVYYRLKFKAPIKEFGEKYNGPRNLDTERGWNKISSRHDEKTVYSRFQSASGSGNTQRREDACANCYRV
jgi:hypothetical protein